MLLVLRLLPYISAGVIGFLFWSQRQQPSMYPWICGLSLVMFGISVLGIAWKRLTLVELMEKMFPSFLLLIALSFGLVLVETDLSLWVIYLLSSVVSALSLELLFLDCFQRERYPVNGLSRLNIALVPLIVWYAVSTSTGLLTFLHAPHGIHVLMCWILGVVLYRTTGHPGATPVQNRLWMLIGLLIGVHVGWLGLHLPVSMPMQGTVAAVLCSAGLRMRRYVYQPKPSMHIAWSEGIGALVLFIIAISTAKWL